MIISERVDKEHSDFEKLLSYSCSAIEEEAKKEMARVWDLRGLWRNG